jgi:hypothetical protein
MVVAIDVTVSTCLQGYDLPAGVECMYFTDYGNSTESYKWFLHASSSITGEPMYPYNYELDAPHYGLQYHLVNSSLFAFTMPSWELMPHEIQDEKRKNFDFVPKLVRYEYDSGDPADIYWYPREEVGDLPFEKAQFGQMITTLDSINDVYYMAIPQVKFPYLDFKSYVTKIFGFYTRKKGIQVMDEYTEYNVVDLQVDSRDHILYGLVLIPGDQYRHDAFYFMRLGYSFMSIRWPTNPFERVQTSVAVFWTFTGGTNFTRIQEHIANVPLFYSDSNISEKYFQIGNGAIDAETNSSYVLYKDRPDTSAPFLAKNVMYKSQYSNVTYKPQNADPKHIGQPPLKTYVYIDWDASPPTHNQVNDVAAPLGARVQSETVGVEAQYTGTFQCNSPENGGCQPPPIVGREESYTTGQASMWITNPDPIYPWFRPRLEYIRFNLDGWLLEVKFENFTNGGIQPTDINGDTLPDKVFDWGDAQIGKRNCTDMFGPNVTQYLMDIPTSWDCPLGVSCGSTCEWYYNDTIRINLTEVETLFLGDPIDLKNFTIYGYLTQLESWTFAAYGIHPTQLPDPLYPPVVELYTIINNVASMDLAIIPEDTIDMCKTCEVDAENSYWHGGTPYYSWYVKRIYCEYFDSYGFTDAFDANITLLIRFVNEVMGKSIGSNTTYKSRGLKRISFPIHGVIEPGSSTPWRCSFSAAGAWEPRCHLP